MIFVGQGQKDLKCNTVYLMTSMNNFTIFMRRKKASNQTKSEL